MLQYPDIPDRINQSLQPLFALILNIEVVLRRMILDLKYVRNDTTVILESTLKYLDRYECGYKNWIGLDWIVLVSNLEKK